MPESIPVLRYEQQHAKGFRDLVSSTLCEFGLDVDPLLERDLRDPSSFHDAVWVAVGHGEVVGTVAMRRSGRDEAELKRMYVRAEWRGQGVGRRLLETALGWAEEVGIATVRLDTAEHMTVMSGRI